MARSSNQPTFDFLTGAEIIPVRQPLRETQRQPSVTAHENVNSEDQRTQLKRLQYELDAIKQERELSILQHEQELRAVKERAEADFKKAQSAQSGGATASRRLDALQREHQDLLSRAANEKAAIERKNRDLQADNRGLREELEDAQAELQEAVRLQNQAYTELEQQYATLQTSIDDMREDVTTKAATIHTQQQKLTQVEAEKEEYEKDILRLKAQTGDSDTLNIIKKELTEQVEYIRRLEETNRQQLNELRSLRKSSKVAAIVEEEKRGLEAKLKHMQELRDELSEAQLQKRILEDEKKSWMSYLEVEAAGEVNCNTPEDLAKAFLQERLAKLALIDQLGTIRPELTVKEENIQNLEAQLAAMRAELDTARTSSVNTSDIKAKARLEKQRNLALKEVDYLRAQINSMKAEETEFSPEQIAEKETQRFQDLEAMLERYRQELQTLHAELSRMEVQPPPSPRKRAREDDEESSERMGELRRRAQALQDDFSQLQTRNHLLEAELKASALQIASLKESTKLRALELRNNPTAAYEAIKRATLTTLREENAALLAQLAGQPSTKVVPMSTLENKDQQLAEAESKVAQLEKKIMRFRTIFDEKSKEFRQTATSLLGWKLDFMPNGRVKATSILHDATIVDGEEVENSITFDGERHTMKVSGGEDSVFAREIKGLVEYWVEGRKEIPCFLAACTIEFYENTTRAQRM